MTPEDITITPMDESHIPSFHECLDSVARERKYLTMLHAPPLDSVIAFVKSHIKAGHPQFVALDGPRVIGWCDAFPFEMLTNEHVARLGIGLLADYRHKGIGSHLMQTIINAVRARGQEKIELEVLASNKNAIAMYEKFGFQHEGVRVRRRKLDGVYEDQVLMGLLL